MARPRKIASERTKAYGAYLSRAAVKRICNLTEGWNRAILLKYGERQTAPAVVTNRLRNHLLTTDEQGCIVGVGIPGALLTEAAEIASQRGFAVQFVIQTAIELGLRTLTVRILMQLGAYRPSVSQVALLALRGGLTAFSERYAVLPQGEVAKAKSRVSLPCANS